MYRQVTRYQQRAGKTQRGFTLVELLVVVVVIAILAAITVILYDNIATNAYDTSLKSDLKNAQDQLEIDHATLRTYPATAAQANGGQGLKSSPGNTLSYSLRPYGYCVTGSNPDASTSFVIRSVNGSGKIEEGDCDPVMTTVAGDTFTTGFADGSASTARFYNLVGLAFDTSGNLFVADNGNRRIRKIAPDGTVSTFAGNGTTGNVNGPGATAEFAAPRSLEMDRTGTLWLADSDNRAVRKIAPDGTVSTLINPSTGTAAWFNRIFGMSFAPDGSLYVMEWYQGKLYKVATNGTITAVAGTGSAGYVDGPGATAKFNFPQGIVADPNGNVYVADTSNNRIRKVAPDGTVSTVAGNGTAGDVDGPLGTGELNAPNGVTIGGDGQLYVTQSNTPLIRVIAADGSISTIMQANGQPFYVATSWGGGTAAESDLVFGSDGALYITTRAGVQRVFL